MIIRIKHRKFLHPRVLFILRYVYAIRLNFRQAVSLLRNPGTTIFSITWQTESVGMRRLVHMREDFENVVNGFIEAYLSENPGIKTTE